MTGMALQVVRSDGVLALYNGLSASLCRQVPLGAPLPGHRVGRTHGRGTSASRPGASLGPGPRAQAG